MKPPIIINVHRVLVKKLCNFLLLSASCVLCAGPEVSATGSVDFTSASRHLAPETFADSCEGCIGFLSCATRGADMGGESYTWPFCLVGSDVSAMAVMGGDTLVLDFGNEGGRAGVSNSDGGDDSCADGVH